MKEYEGVGMRKLLFSLGAQYGMTDLQHYNFAVASTWMFAYRALLLVGVSLFR